MERMPQIPGFHLIRSLGGGSLTAVWAARDEQTDWPCVVKVPRLDGPDPETAVKLLQREARAGLRVRHRHLVRVTQAHVTVPPYFLVMDSVPGEPLRSRLRRDYRLEIGPTLWTVRQLAQAIAALHQQGFLHGDVKPENVLVSDQGSVVLIDLGFAHRPGEHAAYYADGCILGTANYLAPELCGRTPEDSPASDVFSLGVVLFEMLTGQLPYPAGTLPKTLRRHECDPPTDIRTLRDLPNGVANLAMRLLAHDQAKRPRASAVVQHLIQLEIDSLGRRAA
jgi:serine/threonine protein kinase